jgi:hypothetical protein
MYTLLLLIALLACGAFLRAFVLRRRAHLRARAPPALALYVTRGGAFLVGAAALGVAGPSCSSAVLAAHWPATARWPSRAPRCSSRYGSRPCSTRRLTPARPWSHRPTGRSLSRGVARIWSGRRAELALLPAAAVGLAIDGERGGRRAARQRCWASRSSHRPRCSPPRLHRASGRPRGAALPGRS